jgi:hypothetical protein
MDTNMDIKMEFPCKVCNKDYSSYKSLWNHNKKFHNINVTNMTPNVTNMTPNVTNMTLNVTNLTPTVTNKVYECKFCNKSFNYRQNKYQHEKKCKIKEDSNKINQLEEKNNKINELEKTINELKNQVAIIIKEKGKIHHKTLQKINNQLNNINNGTINNITNNIIIPNSQQNLKSVLNNNEKLSVLSSGRQAHIKLTDILYKKDEYKSFRNIYITNLSNDIGYIYDNKEKRFIVKSKKDIMDDYGVERFSDIQYFYEELGHRLNDSKKC